ncbi:MAG: hydrogenase maturation protease [Gemmataceae bacterium]
MSEPGPIRVVGVGSPLADDALAWEVVRRLQREDTWQGAIEFHTVEGGQRLLDLLDGQGTLVLVDALVAGECLSLGTIQRLEWPDARIEALRPGTTHQLRPAEALELAATLGLLPARVVIWGIGGACFDPHSGLSPAVADAVPELARRIADELNILRNRGGHHA